LPPHAAVATAAAGGASSSGSSGVISGQEDVASSVDTAGGVIGSGVAQLGKSQDESMNQGSPPGKKSIFLI